VAAGTGAAQLGLGYGLGVVEWPAVPADDSIWLGSLGWATWIAANATVFGAVIAGRSARAAGPWRFALAASAAIGALLTVALIALPARTAVRTDTFSPQTVAGGYATIGVLLGLVVAYWAVVSRPVAANLIATAAWLWSLAVAAVVASLLWHRPSATYLSSWQFFSPGRTDGAISWPSALLTLLSALVVGSIAVLPAVRRGDLGLGAASSGAVGPLLIAATFFALAPQLTGLPGPLQSAYLIAPYAVLAGLAGSALMVAFGQRRAADGSRKPTEQGGLGGAVSAGALGSEPVREDAGDKTRGRNTVGDSRATTGEPASARADAQRRPRRSFMDRFRRKSAGQQPGSGTGDRPSNVTGRAKATSAAPTPSASPATAGGAISARAKAPGARPGGSARSGVASVDGSARPGPAAAPGRSDSRSTVAPPPASPPTAKINDTPSGEAEPPSTAGRSRNSSAGPTDAATSDKAASAQKTAAKGAKSVPAARTRPAVKPSAPQRSGDSDTAELPVQELKARDARRAGEDESR
jgi:hypothetical protein